MTVDCLSVTLPADRLISSSWVKGLRAVITAGVFSISEPARQIFAENRKRLTEEHLFKLEGTVPYRQLLLAPKEGLWPLATNVGPLHGGL